MAYLKIKKWRTYKKMFWQSFNYVL